MFGGRRVASLAALGALGALTAAGPMGASLGLCLAWGGRPAFAQSGGVAVPASASPQKPEKKPEADPNTVKIVEDADFAAEPLVLEPLGLTMRLARDARVQSDAVGNILRVSLAAPDNTWVVNIRNFRVTEQTPDVPAFAERTVLQLMSQQTIRDAQTGQAVASRAAVLERVKTLRVPGVPAAGERFYVALPRPDGQRVVQGYTVLQPQAEQLAVFELVCLESELPRARRIYEMMLATASFEDASKLATERRDAVRTGVALLGQWTAEDYARAAGLASASAGTDAPKRPSPAASPTQWFRLSRPALSGASGDAQERGYRTLRFFRGTRRMIDPAIDAPGAKDAPPRGTPGDPSGLIAEVSARLISSDETTNAPRFIDVIARFFMTDDREEEAWSVRTAIRTAAPGTVLGAGPLSVGKPALFTETGARSGRTLTVIINAAGQPSRTIRPTVPPEAYLNQAEVYLLPRLLVGSGVPATAGFYAYQSGTESVALRRDTLAQTELGEAGWTLSTRQREGAPPQEAVFRADGTLLRQVLGEGVLMEPVEPEELARLWKSKGLPVGKLD